jgi:DUF1009 family protein
VLLAGAGELPLAISNRLNETGRAHRILALRGFASRALRARADAVVDLLDVRRTIALLDEWRPDEVALAGWIRRPAAGAVLNALSALRNREELAKILSRGDDNVLRGVIALLEERGHRLVSVPHLAPALLAKSGLYGRHEPDEADHDTIATGFRLIAELSPYDVGQAAVLTGRRVLAIEGPEGTDRMLARARSFGRGWFRRKSPIDGILVKGPKRGQDLRVDLPAIGPVTVANAARAGLKGIAVASGFTLVLQSAETAALADRLGLFLIGVPDVVEPDTRA